VNWRRTRSFFPLREGLVYLNHAGVAPISTRAAEALDRFSHEASRYGAFRYDDSFDREVERVRRRVARFLGAQPDEVAFVKNTTEGIGIVASGLDWRTGDRVVTCDLEYPSNVYPWWSLRDRGVETVMLHTRQGRLPLEQVDEALRHPSVRLLSLSSVEYGNGFRHDLPRLGEICRERGVLFCVDAIQSLGCLELDVTAAGIDFLAADGHKWLLSVEGCGVFYCARRVLPLLTPRTVGWRSVRDNWNYDDYHTDLQESAGRFEEGTPNTGGIYALGAAVDLLMELGQAAVEERVLALTDHLEEGLRQRGAELLSPREPAEKSGIVAFRLPSEPPEQTTARLGERGIFTATRRGGVRVSPHFYNTEQELDALLAVLDGTAP